MTNLRRLSNALRNLEREVADQLEERVQRVAFRILEVAAQNTPVNTGELRNGWHITVGRPSGGNKTASDLGDVFAQAQAELSSVKIGEDVWIQNRVPHAPVYEFGLFKPENPAYANEFGGSLATHVPKSRRDSVRGQKLIAGGFSVSAPNGMLTDAIQVVTEALRKGTI